MEKKKVIACFTLSFTPEQYDQAQRYVQDMKKHPKRIFWRNKLNKSEDELVIEQIAHRILSGFYHDNPYEAGKQIIKMESVTPTS